MNNSINVGGNVIGTAAAGNQGGEISTQISSAVIDQLPSSPHDDKPGLKELLVLLQEAIRSETNLSSEDKSDLLEQVEIFAKVQGVSKPEEKASLVRKAKKIFESTLKSLPDTAKLLEACSKLLPMILKTLGFPV